MSWRLYFFGVCMCMDFSLIKTLLLFFFSIENRVAFGRNLNRCNNKNVGTHFLVVKVIELKIVTKIDIKIFYLVSKKIQLNKQTIEYCQQQLALSSLQTNQKFDSLSIQSIIRELN